MSCERIGVLRVFVSGGKGNGWVGGGCLRRGEDKKGGGGRVERGGGGGGRGAAAAETGTVERGSVG